MACMLRCKRSDVNPFVRPDTAGPFQHLRLVHCNVTCEEVLFTCHQGVDESCSAKRRVKSAPSLPPKSAPPKVHSWKENLLQDSPSRSRLLCCSDRYMGAAANRQAMLC